MSLTESEIDKIHTPTVLDQVLKRVLEESHHDLSYAGAYQENPHGTIDQLRWIIYLHLAPTFLIDNPQTLQKFATDLFIDIQHNLVQAAKIEQKKLFSPKLKFREVAGSVTRSDKVVFNNGQHSLLVTAGLDACHHHLQPRPITYPIYRSIEVYMHPHPAVAQAALWFENQHLRYRPGLVNPGTDLINGYIPLEIINRIKEGDRNPFAPVKLPPWWKRILPG